MMRNSDRLAPSFKWLNATQFLGALNDNVFKLLVTFFVIRHLPDANKGMLTNLGTLLFALPFILLLPASGVFADRFSKRDVIVWAKMLEVAVMLSAVAVFALGQPWIAFGLLFLMSAQSAMFGPAKYGIIPELAPKELLSRANGLIVGFTYLAIILGTTGGSWLRSVGGDRFALMGLACVTVAVVGAIVALPMARVPAAGATRRASLLFFLDAWKTIQSIRHDRYLVLAMFGSAYFSLIGAFLQSNVIPYGIEVLGLTDAESGFLFLYAALGIGLGSFAAGRISGRNIEFGVLPLAAVGLGVTSFVLAFVEHSLAGVKALLFFAGMFAGLYIVPLDAFVQWRSPKDRVGETIATTNWLGWIGVLLSGVVGVAMYGVLDLRPNYGFAVVGALTLALTIVTIKVIPDFLVRFIAVTLTRCLYRITTVGAHNLPVEGGALLVSNHVSYMDAVQILATQQRRIRFMMHRRIYEGRVLRPLFKLMGVIPIAMDDPPKKILEALHAARAALDDGFMVCIFAEGALTRTGMMYEFKPGLERIVNGSSHPIIPVYIGGAWGSIFSHYYGRQHARVPAQFPYPVTVMFGEPLPPTATAPEVRQAVTELSCTYYDTLKSTRTSLAERFIRVARRNWRREAMTDSTGRRLSYGRALTGSVALARALGRATEGQDRVGILLPPSVGGALANLAVAMLGKTSVNLNITASAEAFQFAARAAELQTVISSRGLLEKYPALSDSPGLVLIEDLLGRLTAADKGLAMLKAFWLPACLLRPRGLSADDTATILFSSGTTGEPKGVMLSHHNLLSNIEAMAMAFRPRRDDVLCSALPLFHSFGLVCGMWFPLLTGMKVSFHADPRDGEKVAAVVREHRCTMLFATPSFLTLYYRRAAREDFATLRSVIVGAEKLTKRLADAFEEKFGIRPREGYGATELSPVATLNLEDVTIGGILQAGSKEGSAGHPVPGVAVKIVDPETGAPLPPGRAGLLLVKGPNVMRGYLNRPDLTAEAVRDGWYRTGDIAHVDEDGFVFITDRLARFSKIGGEMVPHLAIEEVFYRALGTTDPVLAVTSVPDDRKGERLVVLYTAAAGDAAALMAIMDKSELPNLWKPSPNSYFKIAALPMMGSGKLDVRGLRELARQRVAGSS